MPILNLWPVNCVGLSLDDDPYLPRNIGRLASDMASSLASPCTAPFPSHLASQNSSAHCTVWTWSRDFAFC